MKSFKKAWNIFILVLVPLVAICLSANIVVRLPDVYQYSFKSTQQLKSANLLVESDEFGEIISGFMVGKDVDFKVAQGYEADQKYDFFTSGDIDILKDIRMKLNIILIFGLIALALLTAIIVACKDVDEGSLAGRAIKQAKVSSASVATLMIMFFAVALITNFSFCNKALETFGGSENFRFVVTLPLLKYMYLAWFVVTVVLEVIMLYVAGKITKPKRMFSRGNY